MPRMKNATSSTKSPPHKRVYTPSTTLATSNKVEKSISRAGDCCATPVAKPRGRPPKVSGDSTSRQQKDKISDLVGLKVKKERISEQLPGELSRTNDEKKYKSFNGNLKQTKLTSLLKPKDQLNIVVQQKKVAFTQPSQSMSSQGMTNKRLRDDADLGPVVTKYHKMGKDESVSLNMINSPSRPDELPLKLTGENTMTSPGSVLADESCKTPEAESRSRRSRKPSQKLIELLEFEKEGGLKQTSVTYSEAFKQPSEKHQPLHSHESLEHLEKVSPIQTTTNVSAKLTPQQFLVETIESEPIESSLAAGGDTKEKVCCCCGAHVSKFQWRYQKVYCNPCAYMYTKFISKNFLPPCVDGCDGNSMKSCVGCRAAAMNIALPESKRLSIPTRRVDPQPKQYISKILKSSPTTTIKHNLSFPKKTPDDITLTNTPAKLAGSTISNLVLASKKAAGSTQTISHAIKPSSVKRVTIQESGETSPSSWASELQRIRQTQQKPALKSLNPSLLKLKLGSQKVMHSGQHVITLRGKGVSSGVVYKLPANIANATIIRQSNTSVVSNNKPVTTPVKLLTQPSATLSRDSSTLSEIGVIKSQQAQKSNLSTAIPALSAADAVKYESSEVVEESSLAQSEECSVLEAEDDMVEEVEEVEDTDSDVLTDLGKSESPMLVSNERPDSIETLSGPRVKHVSRSVCKAQGKPAVIQPVDLRLSALPPDEKCKIWNNISQKQEYSDDEIEKSKSAKLQYQWNSGPDEGDDSDDNWRPKAKTPAHRMKIKTKFVSPQPRRVTKMGKRTPRCGNCSGCQSTNCRVCVYCKDMKKYGGPGKMKQCCLERRCIHKPVYKYGPTDSEKEERRARKRELRESSFVVEKKTSRPPKRYRSPSPFSVDGESADMQESVHTADELASDSRDILVESDLTNKPLTELLRTSDRRKQSELISAPSPSHGEDEALMLEQSLMTADGTLITDQNPGFSLVEAYHRLMADFIDTYDIDKVWEQGVAVVTSYPQSTRVLCYLCGSGGFHQLCYCSVCCEPFHKFCLEECDRPRTQESNDWLCRKCRFCQVCGKLNNLLTCDRCTKTYHAECLGSGYTIKPTSAGVWVCNSCVKCTSCGATTPGGPKDKWNSDFSLCASCEALKLKGNFCPICTLCYSDDDWDCKMIGCSTCDSWTHSKCENLPDDLYELIGYIGDDEAQYECRTCVVNSKKQVPAKPDWLVALEQLRVKGFSIICTSLLDKKYAQPIAKIEEDELRGFYEEHNSDLLALEKRCRSQSPSKSRSPTKCSSSVNKELTSLLDPIATGDDRDEVGVSQSVSEDSILNRTDEDAAGDEPCKELTLKLTNCNPSCEPASKPVRRRGRPRKHPLPPNKSETDASTDSVTKSTSLESTELTTRASRPRSGQESVTSRSRSATESADDGTPKRKPHNRLRSPAHSTPVCKSSQEKKQLKSLETPSATSLKRPGRRKEAIDEDKAVTTKDSAVPMEISHDLKISALDMDTSMQDMDTSAHDMSTSSIPDSAVYNLDSADLRARFKDVEWETPAVTFESLKGTGHPLDISSIQTNINNYTSINNFIDDVVRVLQGALTRSRFLGTKYLKQVLASKKLFEQEVDQLFPWCEVHKSGLWEYNLSMPKGMLEQAQLPPSSEHTYARWLRKQDQRAEDIVQPSPYKLALPGETRDATVPFNLTAEAGISDLSQAVISVVDSNGVIVSQSALDSRRCQLCFVSGDDNSNDSGRLIYCGADDWVHVNCAIWSAEVFEEADGTLQKVHAAVGRGRMLECSLCSSRGATVGCCAKGCSANFHFMCARKAGCMFMEDKQVFCNSCSDAVNSEDVQTRFSALRTVTVDFAHAKIKKPWQRGFRPSDITIIAGSLTVENLGYVLPESDYLNLLVPIDFCVSRIYWSTQTPYQRCVYTCKIVKVDAVLETQKPKKVIPDVTICHDHNLPGYTPFAVLAKKYPDIFTEENVEVLRKAAMDYDEQSSNWNSEDEELSDLTGIASALNKAALRSQRKRRKDRKKASILYGSSAPELSGNLDDYVAEMLDMVAEDGQEVLDEKEVVILRDVDDTVAQEVVKVLGQMSKAEADEKGGVQAIMQSILDKYRVSETWKPCAEPANMQSDRECVSQNLNNDEDSTINAHAVLDKRPTSGTDEKVDCKMSFDQNSDAAGDEQDEQPRSLANGETNLTRGRANSVISHASSLEAYSTGSSADNSFVSTDNEDSREPIADATENATVGTPLLSPPKIIITDFSFDEPTDISVDDPFAGVKQTSASVSHCTKDRLKSLVRKRSESLSYPSSPQSEDTVQNVVKRRASSGEHLSLEAITSSIPRVPTACPPILATDGANIVDDNATDTNCKNVEKREQLPHANHNLLNEVEKEESSAVAEAKQSSEKQKLSRNKRRTLVKPSLKNLRPGPKSIKLRQLRKLLFMEYDSDIKSEHDLMSTILSPPPEFPSDEESFGMSFPGKFVFANNFYQRQHDYLDSVSTDLWIRTRDRTPEASESESDEEVERIVAPPNVNCVVRDSTIAGSLPNILNAKVMIERLPQDSDSEEEREAETTSNVPEPFHREPSPPARDISREVRKDMINYCEDEDSSSTDEEEVCKPRVNLRHREKINYNEATLAAGDDSDAPALKHRRRQGKPRPMTGKVMVDSEGSVKSRTENIPSELQKTISDAIRKARNREAIPSVTSLNQGYAGAAQTGNYQLRGQTSYSSTLLADRSKLSDQIVPQHRLKGKHQKCELAALSPSTRKTVLPQAAAEEEIIVQRSIEDTPAMKVTDPSSTFLVFEISSDDGFKVRADNWDDAWRNVTDAVKELRMSCGYPVISYAGVNGLSMFGLQHTSVAYFTEQLYGARYCHNYRFTFHHPPLFEYEEELPETATGCCRSEPYAGRKPTDMFSFVDSRYRRRPVGLPTCAATERDEDLTQKSARRATSMDLPMAMRFRHVKTNAKQAAAVYRSAIHGRGLFCKRPIDSGEMIIEYAGEVIRHELCDKREKYYENKNIGCYMFKIDDQLVVDATMKGNAARFINHSCDPNCFSKVIDVNGSKHIAIFAQRTIQRGEELTYDYKFPFEEVKITCTCGAKKCRGFLN